jgi:hypothetical protein
MQVNNASHITPVAKGLAALPLFPRLTFVTIRRVIVHNFVTKLVYRVQR